MNLIHWNVGYNASMPLIYKELQKFTAQPFLCTLLEITPQHKEELLSLFGDTVTGRYSLDYRKPGKFDGKDRKLGVLFICSKDITIDRAGVFERTLYPDRTLFLEAQAEGKTIKIVGFHSITGCSHKTAKSTNFLSMAESIDEFMPDVLMMDANEPKSDHYNIAQMKFFEDNGRGAGVFFREIHEIGLQDAYTISYDPASFTPCTPLTVSHMINGRKPCRYDFIYVRPERVEVKKAMYDYENAVAASADHAIVVVSC